MTDSEEETKVEYHLAVSWLFRQFASYQFQGKSAYKPDLDNVIQLMDVLKINYSTLKYIHVAGTNGKGSVVNFLGSILKESGYKTGIFTSPHIVDFRERIIVDGNKIDQDFVIDFCEKIKFLDFSPSFFEITCAMAIAYFIEQKCDYVVLETGLGGRLDATNIVHPLLSIITNIGMDHTELLGDTLEKIAFEKAGIIKQDTPIIIGEYNAQTYPVFEKKATEMNAPMTFVNQKEEILHSHFPLDSYKRINERTILTAITLLKELGLTKITDSTVDSGFANVSKNTSYRARFEVISVDPYEIIDVSHNKEGIEALMDAVSKISYDHLHILYGCSSDKNYHECVRLFPKEADIYFTEFSNERSLSVEKAQAELSDLDLNISYHKNVFRAYKELMKHRSKGDLTLIAGSFFLISDFLGFKE